MIFGCVSVTARVRVTDSPATTTATTTTCIRRYVDPALEIKHTKIKHIKDMGFAVKLQGRANYDLFPTLSAVLKACSLFKTFYPDLPKEQFLANLPEEFV